MQDQQACSTRRVDRPHRSRLKDTDAYGVEKRDWRQGVSKRHKVPCATCGGLLHARGFHLQPDHVKQLLAKKQREAERAAASGYQPGQVAQAG